MVLGEADESSTAPTLSEQQLRQHAEQLWSVLLSAENPKSACVGNDLFPFGLEELYPLISIEYSKFCSAVFELTQYFKGRGSKSNFALEKTLVDDYDWVNFISNIDAQCQAMLNEASEIVEYDAELADMVGTLATSVDIRTFLEFIIGNMPQDEKKKKQIIEEYLHYEWLLGLTLKGHRDEVVNLNQVDLDLLNTLRHKYNITIFRQSYECPELIVRASVLTGQVILYQLSVVLFS